jgi:hypothetical protein
MLAKHAIYGGEMVRLLAGVVMLLRQHRVNKRGQCNYCGWTWWTWRLGVGGQAGVPCGVIDEGARLSAGE